MLCVCSILAKENIPRVSVSCELSRLDSVVGLDWDGNGYRRLQSLWLMEPVNKLAGPSPLYSHSPFCVSNELLPWLIRLRCWYHYCVFVTLTKEALLLIVSHGGQSSQYSQPPLSLTDPPPSSILSPIIQVRQVFPF